MRASMKYPLSVRPLTPAIAILAALAFIPAFWSWGEAVNHSEKGKESAETVLHPDRSDNTTEKMFEFPLFERPARIPQRIEYGIAEPPTAKAGEKGSWRLPFVLSEDLPESERLFLQVYGGRNMSGGWRPLQIEAATQEGYVGMMRESGELLKPLGKIEKGAVFEFAIPQGGLRKRERLLVDFGGEQGLYAPTISLPNMFFVLLKGGEQQKSGASVLFGDELERIVGACLIHVMGSGLDRITAAAPSFVSPGDDFTLLIRPEDRHRNVASEEPGNLIVRVNGNELEVRRAAVKRSRSCLLTGLSLPREGVYRLEVVDAENGLTTFTNPIVCTKPLPEHRPLWGMIHSHTENSDGAGSLDHCYTYMRDECGLDFGATSDHDHLWETSDEMWREIQNAAARYNQPGRFTTFLGYEWAKWRQNGDGDRNVYYLKDHRPIYRSDDGCFPSPPDLFAALEKETALVIPHHPANVGNHCDWKDHSPEKERLVEIHSMWGNSERGYRQGNPFPIRKKGSVDPEAGEVPEGFVQRALEMGWRVGFTAGGDDHLGHGGDQIYMGREPFRYKAGLMAAYAKANTREALWEALRNRRCYATTGPRMVVDFRLGDHPMGSEIRLSESPELASSRTLYVRIHGADKIQSIEIVRNNREVHVHQAQASDVELEWQDEDSLDSINLPKAKFSQGPFTFYYLRVTQKDGEMAWSSPIWILSW